MTIYQILCLLSVPAGFLALYRLVINQIKDVHAQNDAIKAGVQALLRAQLLADYNKWITRGYAPIYARDNFENCWRQYHALGSNGVMDDIHDRFMDLPTKQ